jgi:hypothetical protein
MIYQTLIAITMMQVASAGLFTENAESQVNYYQHIYLVSDYS